MSPAGRPKLGNETRKRYNIMLEPAVAEIIRRYGEGNLSAGVQKLAAEAYLAELKHDVRQGKRNYRAQVAALRASKARE